MKEEYQNMLNEIKADTSVIERISKIQEEKLDKIIPIFYNELVSVLHENITPDNDFIRVYNSIPFYIDNLIDLFLSVHTDYEKNKGRRPDNRTTIAIKPANFKNLESNIVGWEIYQSSTYLGKAGPHCIFIEPKFMFSHYRKDGLIMLDKIILRLSNTNITLDYCVFTHGKDDMSNYIVFLKEKGISNMNLKRIKEFILEAPQRLELSTI